MIYVTVHPESVAPSVLQTVDLAVALGESPESTIGRFAGVAGVAAPRTEPVELRPGEALLWRRDGAGEPVVLCVAPTRA
jgi:hypothetical protein